MSLPLSYSTPCSLGISIDSVFIVRKMNIPALNGEACSSDSECLDPKAHCDLLGSLTCVCNSGFLLSNKDNTCKGLSFLFFPRFYNKLKLSYTRMSKYFCWYWESSSLKKGMDDSVKKSDQSCCKSKTLLLCMVQTISRVPGLAWVVITGKIGEVCRHDSDCFSSNSQCAGEGRCACLSGYEEDTNITHHCLGIIIY
mgnify:FL=1